MSFLPTRFSARHDHVLHALDLENPRLRLQVAAVDRFAGAVEFRQADLNADFSFPFDKLVALTDANTALVFVTNPDNPSGHACPASDLVQLAAMLPKRALLVVDEAYVDFAEPLDVFTMLPHFGAIPNLVILRTFSKMYGLAGLRLGYGIMPEWLADLLLRVKLPFSVNILAEQAGLAIDNGIATDALGRTSDPSIWAAGDCASFPQGDGRLRLESVGNAIDMAETVAANMLGANEPYHAKPWFWSDQFDLKLQIAGLNTGYDRIVTRTQGGTSFWYYRGDTLLAVDAMNDSRAYMVGKRLIEAGKSPTAEAVTSTPDLKALLKA